MALFRRTELSIVIDQGDRTLSLLDRGRVTLRVPVAVGTPGTPTPDGRFAVAELIRTGQPGAFLGPIVFPLTGYSNTLNEYAGGNGRVAIHSDEPPRAPRDPGEPRVHPGGEPLDRQALPAGPPGHAGPDPPLTGRRAGPRRLLA